MPKHGWKWRTERLRAMPEGEAVALFYDKEAHVSDRLARWAYENLPPDFQVHAVYRLGWNDRAPWVHGWLWREVERRRAEPVGEWLTLALINEGVETALDAPRFARLYRDPGAHPATRVAAVSGMGNAVALAQLWPSACPGVHRLSEEALAEVRSACRDALLSDIPYARASAAWLAVRLGGMEYEVRPLVGDPTVVEEIGVRVGDHVADALEWGAEIVPLADMDQERKGGKSKRRRGEWASGTEAGQTASPSTTGGANVGG